MKHALNGRLRSMSSLLVAALLSLPLGGCMARDGGSDWSETLTQVSTIDALLEGVYDGVMTFEELATYGDFGIGTFASLDGEMLAVDGRFYQVTGEGVVRQVAGDMTTPFAAVTWFEEDMRGGLPEGLDLSGIEALLDSEFDTLNTFYAIRIDGAFSLMTTRSVPSQQKPYPPLAEVTAHQRVFELGPVAGTVVGFRCPEFVGGVNVPGYHLHFLSADQAAGGHVLALTVSSATALVDVTRDFHMVLPDAGADFYRVDLTPDKQEVLAQVEK